MSEDDDRELAERLARLHAEDPAFRKVVRENAPRLHAIVAADEARRLVPLGVVLVVVGVALMMWTTGAPRAFGAVGAAVGGAVLVAWWSRQRAR